MSDRSNVYLAAGLIYRNHARYLREWIEFHMLMGFERFYLYDNGSDDDHLEILEPYIAEDIVVVEQWPLRPGQFPQYLAFEHCLSKRREETERRRREGMTSPEEARWIAFIDIDEFLFSPTGKPVSDILRDFEAHPAVLVNLALFGTSGHVTEPDGLVIENYSRRLPDSNHYPVVKCIVDPRAAYHCYGAHAFAYFGNVYEFKGARFDEPVWAPLDPVNERHEPITIRHQTPDLSYDLLRINHYYTQSEAQLREKWATRRVDTGELREPLSDRYLELMNAVSDDTIQMHLPALRQAIRDRESGPGQRRATQTDTAGND
jgi:hypothetical protein